MDVNQDNFLQTSMVEAGVVTIVHQDTSEYMKILFLPDNQEELIESTFSLPSLACTPLCTFCLFLCLKSVSRNKLARDN